MATAAVTDTGNHFVNLMGAMRDHYREGPQTHFALAESPHFLAMNQAANTGFPQVMMMLADAPDPVADIRDQARSETSSQVDDQHQTVQSAADQLKSDQNQQSFMDRLNTQRAKAKEDSAATIDKAYDSAIKLGQDASPEQQNQIVAGMSALSTGITQVMNTLVGVISSIVNAIMDVLNSVMDIAKQFAPLGALIAIL